MRLKLLGEVVSVAGMPGDVSDHAQIDEPEADNADVVVFDGVHVRAGLAAKNSDTKRPALDRILRSHYDAALAGRQRRTS